VVYNLRVADWHTYFVGGEGWGWAAWVHNAYYTPKQVTGGPLNGQWILEDQSNTYSNGLQVLDSAGKLLSFATVYDAQSHLSALQSQDRLTYGPSQLSTDNPLKRASDAITATYGATYIINVEVRKYHAPGTQYAGQDLTDVDILTPVALIETKSKGVSMAAIFDKVQKYKNVFDPTKCSNPETERFIIFYCENLHRDKVKSYTQQLRQKGYTDVYIVGSISELIKLL
ncbi:MAG: HINT domain-containing protein, partial [Bacteroidales bacterium]|nr:HINT domain-containing protein [Bacteroidales bacterium]